MLPDLATVRIAAYEDGGSKPLIGHRVLSLGGLRPGYRHIVLRNESGQPLGLATLFVYIVVRDYVPDGLSDFADALVNPIKYQSEQEQRSQQLSVFQDDDDTMDGVDYGDVPSTPVSVSVKEGAGITGGCGGAGGGPGGVTGTGTVGGGDKVGERDVTGSNGDVLVTTSGTTPESTTPRRQNSISHKTQLSTKVSEEKAVLDNSPSALEIVEIDAEDLEKLHNHKTLKEKKQKLEKELSEMLKKHRKERQGLASGADKKKKELVKQHSKLEKKMSSTKSM